MRKGDCRSTGGSPSPSGSLDRRLHGELLDHTLPPPFGDLYLDELAVGDFGHDTAPEGLRGEVCRHLPDLPSAGMALEDEPGQRTACAQASMALEDKELLHPCAVPTRDGSRSDKAKPTYPASCSSAT